MKWHSVEQGFSIWMTRHPCETGRFWKSNEHGHFDTLNNIEILYCKLMMGRGVDLIHIYKTIKVGMGLKSLRNNNAIKIIIQHFTYNTTLFSKY